MIVKEYQDIESHPATKPSAFWLQYTNLRHILEYGSLSKIDK